MSQNGPDTPMKRIQGPCVWRREELLAREGWQHHLSEEEIDALKHALAATTDYPREKINKHNFPLGPLTARIARASEDLQHGSGAFYLRGFPVQNLTVAEAEQLFWGITAHLGIAMPQTSEGDKIFHVRDSGYKMGHPKARGPNTRKSLSFHTDRCDVIGFMCVFQAAEGGENYLVSSAAVHNEVLTRRPDLLETLYQPYYYKRHNVDLAGERPYHQQPIFAVHEGWYMGYLLRELVNRAYALDDLPDMTPAQEDALDLVETIAREPEMHVAFRQEPGDMLFVNNLTTFHARGSFTDRGHPDTRRLLLRIWLSVPNSRPLPPLMAGTFVNVEAGVLRGGFPTYA